VAEVAPHKIFTGVLAPTVLVTDQMGPSEVNLIDRVIEIGKAGLLEMSPGGFRPSTGINLVVKGLEGDAAWSLFALGYTSRPSFKFDSFSTCISRGTRESLIFDDFSRGMIKGKVIVLVG